MLRRNHIDVICPTAAKIVGIAYAKVCTASARTKDSEGLKWWSTCVVLELQTLTWINVWQLQVTANWALYHFLSLLDQQMNTISTTKVFYMKGCNFWGRSIIVSSFVSKALCLSVCARESERGKQSWLHRPWGVENGSSFMGFWCWTATWVVTLPHLPHTSFPVQIVAFFSFSCTSIWSQILIWEIHHIRR